MTEPDPTTPSAVESPAAPPRAFTQGVGTVFQFTGVTMFLVLFFVCCFSSLLSKDFATTTRLGDVGWGSYSGQRAVSVGLVIGILQGMALAGIGLGLQAQRRRSATLALVTCLIAAAFWIAHVVFFAVTAKSIALAIVTTILAMVSIVLLILSLVAAGEMRRDPPPEGLELLPADYKVPYSHLHQDPPEVRLARELEQRRQRLEVQQKELEALEQKLHRKLKQDDA
jgi:hypothetical protein